MTIYDYLHFIILWNKKIILKRFVSDELVILYGKEKEKKNITQITRKERLLHNHSKPENIEQKAIVSRY